SRVRPSSMPRPARRIGTTIGLGLDSLVPVIVVTGVSIWIGATATLRVASYASRVTSSSASWRNTEEWVARSRSTDSLWATSGWSISRTRMARIYRTTQVPRDPARLREGKNDQALRGLPAQDSWT